MGFSEGLKLYYYKSFVMNCKLLESEKRVLDLFLRGKSNVEIAQCLCLSGYTVKTHLTHAYQKFGIAGDSNVKRTTLAIAYKFWRESEENNIKIPSGHPKI